MKKVVISSALLSSWRLAVATGAMALILAACGDSVETVNEIGMDVVASDDALPKCSKDNEGAQALVKGETGFRVCMDGKWVLMSSTDLGAATDFSCKMVELKDKSGEKIVCNGDSIGVVLRGKDGADGKDGKKGDEGAEGKDGADGEVGIGCSILDRTDTTVVVVCGDSTITMDLPREIAEFDSEKIAVSLDSLIGYTQKGPFLKGSTVYLYELSDGRTLKQTNGNFTSNITRDDGRYKFLARDLVSQYAMVVVDGYYRNEVTGQSSNAPIRLKALTNMRKHSSVNVNILTHLEFERVYHLVTQGDSKTKEKLSVKQAKRQAQKEILKQFHIELGDSTDAEDMDVFGYSDADAALLAISILLQVGHTEAEMMALLTEISNEIVETGTWEGARADTIKAQIADRVLKMDLAELRRNVEGWGLSDSVGDFEKFIRKYIAETYKIELCDKGSNGEDRLVDNMLSVHSGRTYQCYNGTLIAGRKENVYLNPDIQYGEMIDSRDRKKYSTVKIGYMTWMAENLDYADSLEYPILMNGGAICYDDNPEKCDKYGRLYTYAAAMDAEETFSTGGAGCGLNDICIINTRPVRGICPEGWHLPSLSEWYLLAAPHSHSNDVLAKGFAQWPSATDKYGFSALPYDDDASYGCYWQAEGGVRNAGGNTFGWYAGTLNGGSRCGDYTTSSWHHAVRCVKNGYSYGDGQ